MSPRVGLRELAELEPQPVDPAASDTLVAELKFDCFSPADEPPPG